MSDIQPAPTSSFSQLAEQSSLQIRIVDEPARKILLATNIPDDECLESLVRDLPVPVQRSRFEFDLTEMPQVHADPSEVNQYCAECLERRIIPYSNAHINFSFEHRFEFSNERPAQGNILFIDESINDFERLSDANRNSIIEGIIKGHRVHAIRFQPGPNDQTKKGFLEKLQANGYQPTSDGQLFVYGNLEIPEFHGSESWEGYVRACQDQEVIPFSRMNFTYNDRLKIIAPDSRGVTRNSPKPIVAFCWGDDHMISADYRSQETVSCVVDSLLKGSRISAFRVGTGPPISANFWEYNRGYPTGQAGFEQFKEMYQTYLAAGYRTMAELDLNLFPPVRSKDFGIEDKDTFLRIDKKNDTINLEIGYAYNPFLLNQLLEFFSRLHTTHNFTFRESEPFTSNMDEGRVEAQELGMDYVKVYNEGSWLRGNQLVSRGPIVAYYPNNPKDIELYIVDTEFNSKTWDLPKHVKTELLKDFWRTLLYQFPQANVDTKILNLDRSPTGYHSFGKATAGLSSGSFTSINEDGFDSIQSVFLDYLEGRHPKSPQKTQERSRHIVINKAGRYFDPLIENLASNGIKIYRTVITQDIAGVLDRAKF